MLKRIKIGDLIKQKKAHSQTGPFGTQLKASDYVEDGIPVINVRNIGFGDIRSDSLEFVDEDIAKELKSHKLRKNDIVFGRKGAVERHSLISSKEEGWIQGSDCIRLRFLTEDYDPRFISYFFLTEYHKQWMINLGSFGATMGSLNQEIISKIAIPDIPLSTQTKIASILSAYDELIGNNKQRIKLLEEMAEEIYKEWFVRLRFPSYETTKFFNEDGLDVSMELPGALPEGWSIKGIFELSNVTYGFPFDSSSFTEDVVGLPIIRIRDIRNNYSKTYSEQETDEKYLVENGDLLVGMDGDFHVGIWAGNQAYLNQRVVRFRSQDDIGKYFMFWSFKKEVDYLDKVITGTTVAHLSDKDLKKIKIKTPSKDLMLLFQKKTDALFDLRIQLELKNQLLQQTRDLLLPRLISGKLSVEHLVEEEERLSVAAEPTTEYK